LNFNFKVRREIVKNKKVARFSFIISDFSENYLEFKTILFRASLKRETEK
jgi:hypothetical protein